MLQSIEVGKGQFVMASSISSYTYVYEMDATILLLKGRKKDPIRVKGDFASKINKFLARGSIILYRDGTMQDRR